MTRVGLILGAGGAAGIAYHAGVLAGLAEGVGWDPRSADLVVGTSAGSITGSALRAGLSAQDQLARALDEPLSTEGTRIMAAVDSSGAISARDDDSGPPRPGDRVGTPGRLPFGLPASPGILRSAGVRPWRVRPGAVMAGLLPAGTVPTNVISDSVRLLCGHDWPVRPLWICAVSLHDGRLAVFGRDTPGERLPKPDLCDAVAASCAIPGYFTPVTIDGARYVDGGAHSLTNLATVGSEDLDLVVVSSPMSRAGSGWRLTTTRASLESIGREMARTQLRLEAMTVRRRGAQVVVFSPTTRDRIAMGRNLMDHTRRAVVARQARESTLRYLERHEDLRSKMSTLATVGA